jgi:hypothetical protein
MIEIDKIKKNIMYIMSFIFLIFWVVVLATSTEGNNMLNTYIILQIVLYGIITLDGYKKTLQKIWNIIFLIYKTTVFLFCLNWLLNITSFDLFDNLTKKWSYLPITIKIICCDLVFTSSLLAIIIVLIILMCFGGCFVICISPFIHIEFYKKVVDIKNGFDKCKDYEKNDICCICISEYDNTTITSKNCNHKFHSKCIKTWISNNKSTCPLCKSEFDKKKKIIMIERIV